MLLRDYLLKNNKKAQQEFYKLRYQYQIKSFDLPHEQEIISLQKSMIQNIPNASAEVKEFLSSLNKGFKTGVSLANEQISVDQVITKIEENAANFYTNEKFQLQNNSPEKIKQNYEQIFIEWNKILKIFSTIDQNGLPGAAMKKYIEQLNEKLELGEMILKENKLSSLGKGSDFLSRLSYVGNMLKGLYLESVGNDMITNAQVGYISIPLGQVLNAKGKQLHYDLLTMSLEASQSTLNEKIRFRVGKGEAEKVANTWEEFMREIQQAVQEEKTVTLLNDDILTTLQGTIQAKAAIKNIRLKNTPTSMKELLKPIISSALMDRKIWALQVLTENSQIFRKSDNHYSALVNYAISKQLNKILSNTAKFYLLRTGFYDTKDMISQALQQHKYVHHIGTISLDKSIGSIVIEGI